AGDQRRQVPLEAGKEPARVDQADAERAELDREHHAQGDVKRSEAATSEGASERRGGQVDLRGRPPVQSARRAPLPRSDSIAVPRPGRFARANWRHWTVVGDFFPVFDTSPRLYAARVDVEGLAMSR